MIEILVCTQIITIVLLILLIIIVMKNYKESRSITINSLIDLLYEVNKYKEFYKSRSETDQLTGVLNKVTMSELCDLELSTGSIETGALMIIDMDNFKRINDILGHDYGDKILVRFALMLKHVFRRDDYISRFGGDEFVVLVRNVDKSIVEGKINYIVKEVPGISIDMELTVSIGVAMIPDNGDSYQKLFKEADKALYSVKSSTKNNYKFANSDESN